ncbi:hypothetical protein HA466_0281080 [Hirschfeldia incana]|nr:hypothetical protein HA466_0281080 [Hirschfeldia incana]
MPLLIISSCARCIDNKITCDAFLYLVDSKKFTATLQLLARSGIGPISQQNLDYIGSHLDYAHIWQHLLVRHNQPLIRLYSNHSLDLHRLIFCRSGLFKVSDEDEVIDGQRKRLKPGNVSPRRLVPAHINKPPYVETFTVPAISSGLQIHDKTGIESMKASGRLAAKVREYAGSLVKPGVTTDEIDEAVHNMIIENGAYPSPLGYGGFPKSVCTSVNECICHGIPNSRPLEDGDIINIDVTVYLNGYHGDTSATFFCGDVDEKAIELVQVTKESLDKAISICGPGVDYKKIGKTFQSS